MQTGRHMDQSCYLLLGEEGFPTPILNEQRQVLARVEIVLGLGFWGLGFRVLGFRVLGCEV